MKKWTALLLALVLVLSMCAGAAAEGEKKYTVGFSNVWVGNTYGIQGVNELEAFLNSNPQVEKYYIYNADNDVNKQISDIEDLIAKGVDMLILQPISAESVAAVVEEAYEAGIVVVDCTSPLAPATDEYSVSVVAKDYDFGYTGMKWLCEQIGGKGNVICLDGMAGLSSAVLRMEGAQDALKEYPDVKIIASEYANWDYATAKPIVENMLATYDQIDAVWSSGGDMTRAAIEAWAEAGRPWVPMMGEDCNGFLKLWKKYKDDGLSCIAVSLPTWLFAYGAELGLQVLNGTYTGEKDVVVEIPSFGNDDVDKYVREDLSDSFWGQTHMTEEQIVALYGNGNDGSQGITGAGAAADLLEKAEMFDIYRGAQLLSGKKSVAFSLTFRNAERTLSDDDVNPLMQKILAACEAECSATLRL